MTDEFVREAERALRGHGAFEENENEYSIETSPFDATVRVAEAAGSVEYRVVIRVPTIDAVVRDERVAPVVQEGWFETLERRLKDIGGVVRVEPAEPVVTLERDRGDVVIETSFETPVAQRGVEDAKAIVDYVEGTYMEGVIPGYEYREPVAGMIHRAQNVGQGVGNDVGVGNDTI